MAGLIRGDDRRRSPRFSCGGEAKIRCLPSDALIPGKLLNLSMGGICVEAVHPIDLDTRTEILVNVNAASFRTVGLVRAILGRSRACMEFVQMSAGSKDMLADLIEQLAKFQAAMKKLRSARLEAKSELIRELQQAGVWVATVNSQFSVIRQPLTASDSAQDSATNDTVVETPPLVIGVDLFG